MREIERIRGIALPGPEAFTAFELHGAPDDQGRRQAKDRHALEGLFAAQVLKRVAKGREVEEAGPYEQCRTERNAPLGVFERGA